MQGWGLAQQDQQRGKLVREFRVSRRMIEIMSSEQTRKENEDRRGLRRKQKGEGGREGRAG